MRLPMQVQCEYCLELAFWFFFGLFVLSVVISLEAAASENLSQEAIIENLDPVEAARLSKVRNIGIAVRRINQDPDFETVSRV